MEKLIFIGIDGLSWNLIEDLMAKGNLKNIKELIKTGVSGIMKADHPLLSPQIWTSIFTGKKQEKHGIKDFYSTKEDLKSDQIWDILHNNGFSLGIYRALSALSLKKVDDFFIPSFYSFEKEAYPRKLTFIHELDQKARSNKLNLFLIIKIFWKLFKSVFPIKTLFIILKKCLFLGNKNNNKKRFHKLKDIEFLIHTNLFYKLLKKYKSEFSIIYENACDSLSHIYWNDYEQNTEFSKILPNIYFKIDKFFRKINKYAKKNNITLLIVSDHGFRGVDKFQLYKRSLKVFNLLKELNLENDIYGSLLGHTALFRLKTNSLITFENLKKIFESISYKGEKLFIINDLEENLIVKLKTFIEKEKGLEIRLNNRKSVNVNSIIDFNYRITGLHDENNGFFLIKGHNIKEGEKLVEVKPYDITPTILTLLGVPIPSETDGKVLKEIFKIEPKISFYDEKDKENIQKPALSKEEEEKIKEQLRSLGYL